MFIVINNTNSRNVKIVQVTEYIGWQMGNFLN